jgi:uncharacterized membrane protein
LPGAGAFCAAGLLGAGAGVLFFLSLVWAKADAEIISKIGRIAQFARILSRLLLKFIAASNIMTFF